MRDEDITRLVIGEQRIMTLGTPVGPTVRPKDITRSMQWQDGRWSSGKSLMSSLLPSKASAKRTLSIPVGVRRYAPKQLALAGGALLSLGLLAGGGYAVWQRQVAEPSLPIAARGSTSVHQSDSPFAPPAKEQLQVIEQRGAYVELPAGADRGTGFPIVPAGVLPDAGESVAAAPPPPAAKPAKAAPPPSLPAGKPGASASAPASAQRAGAVPEKEESRGAVVLDELAPPKSNPKTSSSAPAAAPTRAPDPKPAPPAATALARPGAPPAAPTVPAPPVAAAPAPTQASAPAAAPKPPQQSAQPLVQAGAARAGATTTNTPPTGTSSRPAAAGLIAVTPDGKTAVFTNPQTRLPQQFKIGEKLQTGETIKSIDATEGVVTTDARTYRLE